MSHLVLLPDESGCQCVMRHRTAAAAALLFGWVWVGWVGLGLLCSLASCLVMLSHDFQPVVWDLPGSLSCCGSTRQQENVLVAGLNPLSHQFITSLFR
jgi:hypothetical protein